MRAPEPRIGKEIILLTRNQGRLEMDGVDLADAAERFGTPLWVYSRPAIEAQAKAVKDAFAGMDARFCFAVKANSNLSILRLMADLGFGFDVVSIGELKRVVAAGAKAQDAVFSGVGKTDAEIGEALAMGVGCFNVESESELKRLARIAQAAGRTAPLALRVNPDVDPQTHPYISTGLKESKFGVPYEAAPRLAALAAQTLSLKFAGVACHIGSGVMDPSPFLDAARKMLDLADRLESQGIRCGRLDMGGGFGVDYSALPGQEGEKFLMDDYAQGLKELIGRRAIELAIEPGRFMVARAGALLGSVVALKEQGAKRFAVLDAGMGDLIRPALYGAKHPIVNCSRLPLPEDRQGEPPVCDVVGPICESGDFLAKDEPLFAQEGDVVAALCAGAYGSTMSGNYNSRPLAAEIMTSGGEATLIRRRQRLADMWRDEIVPKPDQTGD